MTELNYKTSCFSVARCAALAMSVVLASCSGGGGSALDPLSGPAGTNNPPRAFNVQTQAQPGNDLILRVLDTSLDRDGDSLKIVYVTQPAHGTVTIEDNGTPGDFSDDYLRYVCDDVFVGVVSFQYTISDGKNGRATGVIQITVGNPLNNLPLTVDDAVTTAMNTPVAIEVLANDSDPDGDSLTIGSFTTAINGAVAHDDRSTADPGDDWLVYTPAPGFTGIDTFSYSASDGTDSAPGIVTVTVGVPVATETVCGIVMKGALRGALVSLLPVDATGNPAGAAVAQAITDSTGRWCADVPLPRGNLLVRSSGGGFDDETDTAGNRSIVLNAGEGLETYLPGNESFVSLNVFTNAILEKSRNTAGSGSFAGIFAADRVFYRTAFGWPADLLATTPSDAAALDPADPETARIYGMALGGVANVINDVAVRFARSQMTFEMIRAVIVDLSDCVLDGYHFVGATRTPVVFSLSGTPTNLPTDLDLNLSILRFRNNNLSEFGGTPLAQIEGSVCLGAADDDDTVAPVFIPDPLADLSIRATGPLTDLLAVTPVPLASDNIDPSPDVQAIAITTASGTPVPLGSPNVPPGSYDITWQASDSASTPNTTVTVQRVTILANDTGTVVLEPASFVPGTALSVTVSDADHDVDGATADTVSVVISNLATLETETVVLTETGPATAVFNATLDTLFGTSPGLDNDALLVVEAGQTVEARYDDALDISGNPAVATDQSDVDGGFDGSITMSPASIVPGDTLTITVTDTDLDTDPGLAETLDITVTEGAESETVTLTETTPNSGIFSASLPTQFGTAGNSEDGIVDVQAGNTIVASYDDVLLGNGGSATVSDSSAVGGGTDGSATLAPDPVVVGDLLMLSVTDPDLNTNPAVAETVNVSVSDGVETETVLLTETAANTGVFSGSLPTQFGTAGPDEDGILDVQDSQTITLTYLDALTLIGNSVTRTDASAVNGGTSGTIVLDPDPVVLGDSLLITVSDIDLDTNPGLAENATATVINTVTGEAESVLLTETGINTGVFTGSLPTQLGAGPGPDNNGVLDAQVNQQLEARYDDAFTDTGGTATVTDAVMTTGGIDGTITITPANIVPGDTLTITVDDADLDTNPGVAETVDITVTEGAETETVTLTETTPNSGVFSASLPTQFGTAGNNEDGIVDVQNGSTVVASYDDALTGIGGT
ncbi:MAG: cadherin-like domain-containing protein, partial [Gammaproteobacteria bacterium]|nr:cadherin-like domain-containing protein [Gammaproteobacteria bacterium]NNF60956.1 cadherin-like domain-containing protein [Gammaproteobacteria bacterium]NNM21666.1 cadherin-like domain-containing protein [Gammaproteobacteria bacterium]